MGVLGGLYGGPCWLSISSLHPTLFHLPLSPDAPKHKVQGIAKSSLVYILQPYVWQPGLPKNTAVPVLEGCQALACWSATESPGFRKSRCLILNIKKKKILIWRKDFSTTHPGLQLGLTQRTKLAKLETHHCGSCGLARKFFPFFVPSLSQCKAWPASYL
jgi:hypothetical protein